MKQKDKNKYCIYDEVDSYFLLDGNDKILTFDKEEEAVIYIYKFLSEQAGFLHEHAFDSDGVEPSRAYDNRFFILQLKRIVIPVIEPSIKLTIEEDVR